MAIQGLHFSGHELDQGGSCENVVIHAFDYIGNYRC